MERDCPFFPPAEAGGKKSPPEGGVPQNSRIAFPPEDGSPQSPKIEMKVDFGVNMGRGGKHAKAFREAALKRVEKPR